jgi:hypothetical protein
MIEHITYNMIQKFMMIIFVFMHQLRNIPFIHTKCQKPTLKQRKSKTLALLFVVVEYF